MVYDLAVKLDATVKQLTEIIFAYPTLSVSIFQVTEGIFGQSVYLPKDYN